MSGQNRKDFDNRLAELNNWQIEQQKKLKAFQEAQRRLLDLEHQNVLSSLSTHNFGQWCDILNEGISKNLSEKETSSDAQMCANSEKNGIFQLKYQPIKLHEPKSSYFSYSPATDQKDGLVNKLNEDFEETESHRPRKFLRRGEGLARFRMTLDDFKGPPKIYKEKKIKTYLNSKPEYGIKSNNYNNGHNKCVKTLKKNNNKVCRNLPPKPVSKSLVLPVKIYVPETKTKQSSSGRNSEGKSNTGPSGKKCNFSAPKVPMESLPLKPCSIATEWYHVMKEKEKKERARANEENANSTNGSSIVDVEKKKDDKELQIFEILEKKVNDSSFCSTSSFVDKLMEHSLSSTPSKPISSKDEELHKSYSQGLKSLRAQFLDEEQVKKLEELDEFSFDEKETSVGGDAESHELDKDSPPASQPPEPPVEEACESEPENMPESDSEEPQRASKGESPQPHKVNKSLLQEYIKDFKKFKCLLAENVHRIEEPEEEVPPQQTLKEEKEEPANQHEIALKLRRKGLQDNVKQLLNWECPPRKKQPKRVIKKFKPKPKPKSEKSKPADKEEGEKIVFSSSLLKVRLNELEEEIEIFRKENRNLEKLQKECGEERTKLVKERKEFERQMQEEKEAFEAKMAEEQKKLQKEKTVFEKYCKQVKNQPTRQEREEVANLKKEIEKLTETLTTKEARWGASQARLRNQIKNLEKENSRLKAEMEKYKKQSMKKVSFENERMLNTKIIHVINAELGKLKPAAVKNGSASGPPQGRNECLSARSERSLSERPIRRIKSASDVKRQEEVAPTETSNDYDDKAPCSASTDSGIETNGSRYASLPRARNSASPREYQTPREVAPQGVRRESASGRSTESIVESAVREAVFGGDELEKTRVKMAEVKSRLKKLNLNLNNDAQGSRGRMARLSKERGSTLSESEVSGSSGEEEEEEEEDDEEDKENEIEMIDYFQKKSDEGQPVGESAKYLPVGHSVTERKLDENGAWEKSFEDGSKEIRYPNGNVKKILPGNKIVKMVYYNGDVKETNVSEGSEKYYYAETKTWHITYEDGLEVLEFPNGQTERRHADGSIEISFPNGCVRYCDSSGRDEWRFSDGTVIKTNESGHKILLMPNGQKEIHTKEFKRREYPDGTVKILYADGTQETRYSSGRVRLKDKDGNLVMDSGGIR